MWSLFRGTIGWWKSPSQLSVPEQALDSLPPERLFDLHWATTVVEHALQRLREECERKGKLWLFQALSPHLTDVREEVSYAKLSAELGMADTAVKKTTAQHAPALPQSASRRSLTNRRQPGGCGRRDPLPCARPSQQETE